MQTIEFECTFGSDSIGNFMKYRIAKLLWLFVVLTIGVNSDVNAISTNYGSIAYIQDPQLGTSSVSGEVNDPLPISGLFQKTSYKSGLSTLEGVLKDASFLDLDVSTLQSWLSTDAPEVHLSLPQSSRSELLLELKEVDLLTDDFKITTDKGDFDMSV
jgi:hypothetical protein